MRLRLCFAALVCLLTLLVGTAAAQSAASSSASPASPAASASSASFAAPDTPAALAIGNAPHYALDTAADALLDGSRSLTIEQILMVDAQQQFLPVAVQSRNSNFGITASAVWLRIPLQLQTDAPANWQLEVAYPALDSVELFVPQPDGSYQRLAAGDSLPFAQQPLPQRNPSFPLQLRPGAEQTVYVRVLSQGTVTVPLQLWQPTALTAHDHASYGLFGLYFGLVLGLALYNLLLFVSLRDPLYLVYTCAALAMAVGQLGVTGLGAEFVWPNAPRWNNVSALVGLALAGAFACIFTRKLLHPRRKAPLLDRLLLAQAALFALAAAATAVLPLQAGSWLLNVSALLFAALVAAVGLHALQQGHPAARSFALAWTALLLGVVVFALHNLGLLPSTPAVQHALMIGSAAEMLLLAFALADRIHLNRRETARARSNELAMLEALREHERLLEERVRERTQDLETANQQLQDNEFELALQANHDALTGLANRKLLQDRLELAMQHAKRHKQGFAVLMLDLNGFKQVNDQYGHSAGDTVLQSVALRLTSTVRGVDTVARVGGDEFMLILDAVNSAAPLMAIVRKVREALALPITLDSNDNVQVGVSIGMAMYPVDGASAEQLFSAADAAMYASKKTQAPLPVQTESINADGLVRAEPAEAETSDAGPL